MPRNSKKKNDMPRSLDVQCSLKFTARWNLQSLLCVGKGQLPQKYQVPQVSKEAIKWSNEIQTKKDAGKWSSSTRFFVLKCISSRLTKLVFQILLFANSQNNMERKKFSSPTVWQIPFLITQKPANETKSPAKRTKSPAKRTKSPAQHEEKDRCQVRSPCVYWRARQGDMLS